ncbi:MAG: sulfotransferase family protein [Acidimicrobiales bacterium]
MVDEGTAWSPGDGRRLVFVGGLHRSGTTFLAGALGQHPLVSGLRDTGVWEDEGQHLQSVYPIARAHGGPGRFGFAEAMHMTEASPLATADAARSLLDAWRPYWDEARPVSVEKSPPNLVKMRFLQALFPSASFIVLVRHPVAVALATKKWSETSDTSLIEHWVVTHETVESDLPFVRRVMVVRYEDMVARFAEFMRALFGFLELPPVDLDELPRADLTQRYLDRWSAAGPIDRARHRWIRRRFASRIGHFGYDLDVASPVGPLPPTVPSLLLPNE